MPEPYSLPGGGGPKPPVPYRNPFRSVRGLAPERIDMGVDYQGSGPVYALGSAVVTEVDTAWARGVGAVGPGTFIAYRLTDGPASGHYVYISENISPNVRVGQRVDSQTVIGTMTGQGAGIETGWAAGPSGGVTLAAASGQASTSGDPGANPTGWGYNFAQLLAGLGAPPGLLPGGVGAGLSGTAPAGIVGTVDKWAERLIDDITGAAGKVAGGAGGALGGLLSLPGDVLQAFDQLGQLATGAMWFFQPSNWVRIIAGLFGVIFFAAGIAALTRAA